MPSSISTISTIPRLLLRPSRTRTGGGGGGGPRLWEINTRTSSSRRCYASKPSKPGKPSKPSKPSNGGKGNNPIVLEKPAKFNPPSHGSKLPNKSGPRHYGGVLSDMEMKAQARKDYPGLPPPPNTFGYWFWKSPKVHAWISIGTLGALAAYSLTRRFLEDSPYGDMMPSFGEWARHPIESMRAASHMVVLHIDRNTAEAVQLRRGSLEDITKRRKYLRAHNIEEQTFAHKIFPESFLKPTEDAMDEAYGDPDEDAGKGEEKAGSKEEKKGRRG